MGGMLYSTTEGVMYGIIAGLENSEDISQHVIKNGTDNLEIPDSYTKPVEVEYYIGYGTGYEQGQNLRKLLKNDISNPMSLEDKVSCLSFLLREQRSCRQNLTQSFVDNIKFWGIDEVPSSVKEEIQGLLQGFKVQQAVDQLISHYKKNFQLKSLKKFYSVYKKLKEIRQQKKTNKKYLITEDLEKLKKEIWMHISME